MTNQKKQEVIDLIKEAEKQIASLEHLIEIIEDSLYEEDEALFMDNDDVEEHQAYKNPFKIDNYDDEQEESNENIYYNPFLPNNSRNDEEIEVSEAKKEVKMMVARGYNPFNPKDYEEFRRILAEEEAEEEPVRFYNPFLPN